MNKAYIVIYTESGDTCDGYPRSFSHTYKTRTEAYADMEADATEFFEEIVERDDDGIIARRGNTECIWAVREIEIAE